MIPLTPHHLAAMYECLRAFPPFDKWMLPPADEVEFHVTRSKAYHAQAQVENGQARIWFSSESIGKFETLASIMAHEMTHIHQMFAKTETPKVVHNKEFKALRRQSCEMHGWDWKLFN